MAPSLLEIIAALYLSSLLFFFIPVLGTIVCAIAGRLTPGVSAALGALVGLVTSITGLGLAFLVGGALQELLGVGSGLMLFFITALCLPPGGALSPVVVVPLMGRWQSDRQA